MTAFFHLHVPLLHKSLFLGQTNFTYSTQRSSPTLPKFPSNNVNVSVAKFNIYEIMGGRGLCNGEVGIQQELEKSISKEAASRPPTISSPAAAEEEKKAVLNAPDNAFEKELLSLTGGFPGGEKDLKRFIEKNLPPKKKESSASEET